MRLLKIVSVLFPVLLFAGKISLAEEELSGLSESKKATFLFLADTGDQLYARSRPERAVVNYLAALKGGKFFSLERRIAMIERISWHDRLEEAIKEDLLLLEDYPDSTAARLMYAEHLTWSGHQLAAIEQVDQVLKKEPGNSKALLIRADASAWKGNPGKASDYYYRLLNKEDSFAARLGYAYSLLDQGFFQGAEIAGSRLSPENPQEEKEVIAFNEEYSWNESPGMIVGTKYYNDTEDNERFGWQAGFRTALGNTLLTALVESQETENKEIDLNASSGQMSLRGPITPTVRGEVGAGLIDFEGGDQHFLGRAELEAYFDRLALAFSLSREGLTETAAIVSNQIRFTQIYGHSAYSLTDRIRPQLKFWLRDYSDDNESVKVRLDLPYSFHIVSPRLEFGYRQEYTAFDRQSQSGYFDPDHTNSFQGFLSLSHYDNPFHGYLELFSGYQRTRRYEATNSDVFVGFYGQMEYRVSSDWRLGIETDGGDYALDTSSGFEYLMVSLFVKALF